MKDPNKSTSLRRQAASRANGAKSRGPVTPEGKARSSRNATRHGCLAAVVTLSPEDESAFGEILDRYIARFEPRDQPEYDLVEQIVWANFKMRQVWIQETAILGLQVAIDRDKVDMEWLTPSEYDRRALALVESIKDSNALSLLQRYSRSLASQAERAIKLLVELKKQRLPPVAVPSAPECGTELPNEPNPEIEHPEITPEAHNSDAGMQPEPAVAYVRDVLRTPRIHLRHDSGAIPLARAAAA